MLDFGNFYLKHNLYFDNFVRQKRRQLLDLNFFGPLHILSLVK